MASAPRLIISGKVYELTFRTEIGLPLICALLVCKILKGHLAAATKRYQIRPVGWAYMGNHVHMLVIVDNPAHLPEFVAYLKRESAHAINKLLGRNQRTVWKDGYDPVVILDAEKLIQRLIYFYLNPARANLVESIDLYPGLTSWVNGFTTRFTLSESYIPRAAVPTLATPRLTDQEDRRLTTQLMKKLKKRCSVEIDCLAWMECFAETKNGNREEMAKRIRDAVYEEERRLATQRKCPVIGASALRRQSMLKAHAPKKIGSRMLCLGSNIEQRKEVISWFKSLFKDREEKRKLLGPQEFLNHVFPGFFRPGNFMQANLNPLFVPF